MLYTTILTAFTPTAHAECGAGVIFCNPLEYDTVGELLLALTDGITIILMPIIVLAIAYIGFRMVLAGKEKNADYSKWKDAFGWSLVGLFLVLGARGILFVIQNTINDVLGDEYQVEVVEKALEEQE
ncbi:MAG: pilin [Candidatus Kaiserbacteria bacterium]|nr:pilin [Candidatus Kaiserbacteria bacterium]